MSAVLLFYVSFIVLCSLVLKMSKLLYLPGKILYSFSI